MADTVKHIALEVDDVEMKPIRKQRKTKPVPVYFKGLTIANVKCFKEQQRIDFTDASGRPAQWTVILGENGVGKTTVLQSLAALQPTPVSHRETNTDFYLPLSTQGQHVLRYITSVFFVDRSPDGPPLVESDLYCGERLTAQTNRAVTVKRFGITGKGSGIQLSMTANKTGLQQIGHLVCYGYGAARRVSGVSLARSVKNDTTASLYSDDAELLNAEEWLLQADYAASKQSRVQQRATKRRNQVVDVLVRLLPGISAIRFVNPTAGDLEPSVEFRTPYAWVRSQELSLGYRTMIGWMVDLASRMFDRYPRSQDPLAESAVVLVDEIDLHMHPAWQRSLMGRLSEIFPNTQFIVTAHSPLIVQGAPNVNVVLLKRIGGQVVVDNDIQSVRGWRVDQILTSDLFGLPSARDPELDPLINKRKDILSKVKLTEDDRQHLAEIDRKMGVLPVGETSDDMRAMDLIRRIALVETGRKQADGGS